MHTFVRVLSSSIDFCIVFIRYKQVAEYNKQDELKVLHLNSW